jgi:hypothetical protein
MKLYEATFTTRPGVTFQVEAADEVEAGRLAQKLAETKAAAKVTEVPEPADDGYDFATTLRFLNV